MNSEILSRILASGELSAGLWMTGLAAAFALGAVHALSPGHGKALVAAYLVGARGTLRHAVLLGAVVTLTHTASVFFLGVATLFLSKYVVPDRLYPIMGAISGASILLIGISLLRKRVHALRQTHHHHHHDHHHAPEEISLGSLIALGASGGLVPCPSAMVLLLSAIALRRTSLGIVLLVAFSLGLAVVLIGVGAAVLYAQRFAPVSRTVMSHPGYRYLPVGSAAFISILGAILTANSLGWLRW